MPGCELGKEWIHCREKNPKKFDPRSFRWKKIKGGALLIACPKGQFKKGRCKVGMQVQARKYPATAKNKRKLLKKRKRKHKK